MSKLYLCKICNKKKQPNEFYIYKSGKRKDKIVNYTCKCCSKEKTISEEKLEYNRNYHRENYEVIKEKRKDYFKKYYLDNREKQRDYCREYGKNNPHIRSAREAKRRSKKLGATPSWLSKEQVAKIKSIYKYCKIISEKTGIKHHVDHIVPLQGKLVSGLHVPWNLQVIPMVENLSKSNKLIEDIVCS